MNFLAKADSKTRSLTATLDQTKPKANGWMKGTAAHISAAPMFTAPDPHGTHQQLGEFTTPGGAASSKTDECLTAPPLPHTLKTTPTAANPTPWSLAA